VGDNPSSLDQDASLTPLPGAPATLEATGAEPSAVSWRQGLRLEAVANLAHELRTPVQVLLGYVDILRDDHGLEFSPETHAVLDRMNANVHDLAQTVDNLMHFVLSEVNAEAMIDEDVPVRASAPEFSVRQRNPLRSCPIPAHAAFAAWDSRSCSTASTHSAARSNCARRLATAPIFSSRFPSAFVTAPCAPRAPQWPVARPR
jgi:phospho-acceptor domain-containing protein